MKKLDDLRGRIAAANEALENDRSRTKENATVSDVAFTMRETLKMIDELAAAVQELQGHRN